TVALVPVRQRLDLLAKLDVAIRARCVAKGAGAHLRERQGSALAQATFGHLPHQRPSRRCGYGFFRRTSLMTSFSNICSASSFFRRTFSDSSSLSRLASDTLMPPNLLRHR